MMFSCTPILLNEIELAMILRVKIAKVATRLDKFLELGLLSDEIGLEEKEPPTAAVHTAGGAFEVQTLSRQPRFRPQPAFTNDFRHALEPLGHGRVLFGEIK